MSLLGKLAFWKKKDEFDFDDLAEKEMKGVTTPLPEEFGFDQKPAGLDEKPFFPDEGTEEPKSPFGQAHFQETSFPSRPQARMPSASITPNPSSSPRNIDLELINSKLDTLKAMLSSLDQRMSHFEQSTAAPEKKQRLW